MLQIQIEAIYISPGHDFKGRHGKSRLNHGVEAVESVECVAGMGLRGDRYYGHAENFKGQISLISREVIRELQSELDLTSICDASFRRNVVISGVDLNELIGKQFSIGEVEFYATEECRPCYWMDQAIGDGAFDALKGRGGLRCRVLSSGELHVGVAGIIF